MTNDTISGMGLYIDSSDKTMTYYSNSFEYNWDTNTTYAGVHKIKVTAVDSLGNAEEKEISIYLNLYSFRVNI